ncbi:MAG: helix-turn-helix domain-containing protein [Clostridium sp.]|nr:helix-turn-helix domain-containing protein [Clostridium sp.]
MEHTGLPISQFADTALIPRPTLSQILSGRNKKISNEVLEKLHDAFPDLNVAWLLFGDGEMLRKGVSAPAVTVRKEQSNITPSAAIPNIDTPASAIAMNQTPLTNLDAVKDEPQRNCRPEKRQNPQISLAPDTNKKIQTIMVFYTDNSFEIFTPSQR